MAESPAESLANAPAESLVIAVPGHDESVVKRRLELVLEIGRIQSLGNIVGDPVLMQGNAQSPVVAHSTSLTVAAVQSSGER